MSSQAITPELREWIVAQAKAGCRPEDVLQSMRTSGWDEETALDALETTLEQYLAKHAAKQPTLPPPVPVPEPDLAGNASVLQAPDRQVEVLMAMRSPRLVVFGGLLSDDECEQMIELARPRLARSETVHNPSGGSEVHDSRTSHGMFFERGESTLIDRIERRIAALVNWPVENGEGLQVLHYRPGAEYKAHHDYFDPAQPGTPTILQRGGQRVGTVVMYLNTPQRGGGTAFPDVGVEVGPMRGNAVFFSYDRPHVVTRTLHAGMPVLEGEKWVATKWLREREFR
ncbi:MAG TPA: 2OG-Fe(II) oxygenase [Burkholderiaceae bacterium]|nr:2OG-Fe(II) oxygenase [Burkholderiaceae bacterium]